MNKAFVREPEPDGRAYCPRCSALGAPVEHQPLDRYIRPESRGKLGDTAWFCTYAHCQTAYFNTFGATVDVEELTAPVYPKDPDGPICACFGLVYDDVAADIEEGTPNRVRELLAKSKTSAANCQQLAADGRCCTAAVQELYMRLRGQT